MDKDIDNNLSKERTLKSYQFLCLEDKELKKYCIIKAFAETPKDNKINDKLNKIKVESSVINKEELNKYLTLLDGIIVINVQNNSEKLNSILSNIPELDKQYQKLNPQKFFPKYIVGNKLAIINYLRSANYKEEDIANNFHIVDSSSIKNIDIYNTVEELIRMKQINENYKKFLLDIKSDEKGFINSLSESSTNLLKCFKCNQIPQISMDKYLNSIYLICNKCNLEKKYGLKEYESIKKKHLIKCSECKKEITKKKLVNYCFDCKTYICKDCIKKHFHSQHKNVNDENKKYYIYPNNLVDFVCNIHEKICYNYCLECENNICPNCETQSHLNHRTQLYNEKEINELIETQKKRLKSEQIVFGNIKKLMDDCFNLLKIYFQKLIIYKKKEIEIKEGMIKELEIFKYSKTLIENVKSLEFENNDIYNNVNNNNDSWDQKINNIFQFFNQSIEVKNYNLCHKENLKGPFGHLKKVNSETENENDEGVTDLCSLNQYLGKNYFAASFNNGLLKIYNDNLEYKVPTLIVKEFEPYDGINSLYKTGENSLLLIGNSIIKKIKFFEDYTQYEIINEIEIKEQYFKFALEFDSIKSLLITNNLNQINFYNYKTRQHIPNISKINDENEEIIFIDKISDNKIILQLSQTNLLNLVDLNLNRDTIDSTKADSLLMDNNSMFSNERASNLNFMYDNNTILLNDKLNNINDNNEITSKIIEFEFIGSEISIKKNHTFDKGINYLGKINDQLLLFYNKSKKKIIIFDVISYQYYKELNFNSSLRPISSFCLNKNRSLINLLMVNEGGFISQCTLNKEIGFIHVINKIAIKVKISNEVIDLNQNIEKKFKDKSNIVKIVNLEKTNFLIVTQDSSIFNLKASD